MAKNIVKYIEKDRLYRYMPNNSIDKNVLDKVYHMIGSMSFVGNFYIKGFKNDAYLYELDSADRELVANIPLKENEFIFRYITYNTAIGGISPLIKINIEKLLAYFSVFNDEDDFVGFTKKGEPIEYLNLIEYYSYSFDEELFMGTQNEMDEHGMSFVDAEKTANDHLKEDKHYYSKMKYFGLAEGGEISVEIVNKDKVFNKDTYKGIYGDNDNDGIPNADDPNPNIEGDRDTIEQVQLVDLFDKLLNTKNNLDSAMYEQIDNLKEISPKGSKVYARTKTPYSILNKLIAKKMLDKSNPNKGLTDMVGTTIVTKSFDDINYLKDKIQAGQLGKVVDFDDYYSHPKNGYMAYHFIILDKNTDIPFEVQLKTERMKKLNRASHNAYKYENLDGSKLLRYTRMAQKADEGNLKAQKSFDILTKDMEDLEMSLFKDKTKIKKHD
jgi:ppGpp synthetase/RelA/SpoT-type nucleotidyltranferase